MANVHAFSLIQLANAMALASLLTLLATGLALVFGLRDVMNFAHGAMFMLGAYLAYSISGRFNFWTALIAVPALLGLVGAAFEFLAIRPLRRRSQMDVALLTFGLALILSQLVIKIWGTAPLSVSAPAGLDGSSNLLGQPYPTYRLFLIAVGFSACICLAVWLKYARMGMHVRAVSQNPHVSRILGVNTDRLGLVVVCMGTAYAVIGGLGSIGGAIAAAMAYGLIEVLGIACLTHPSRDGPLSAARLGAPVAPARLRTREG